MGRAMAWFTAQLLHDCGVMQHRVFQLPWIGLSGHEYFAGFLVYTMRAQDVVWIRSHS